MVPSRIPKENDGVYQRFEAVAYDTFVGSDQAVLIVTTGSLAEQYAKDNGIVYTSIEPLAHTGNNGIEKSQ